MKNIATRFILFCSSALLLIPGFSLSQTITINSVSATQFCMGDTISATFTATGTWGHKNAFTLQLSDVNGSFANSFTNLGSFSDTVPGTFALQSAIPVNLSAQITTDGGKTWQNVSASSSLYRVRIIAAFPYTMSADNGTDITIKARPTIQSVNSSPLAPLVGTSVNITVTASSMATVDWNFGIGANPPTASDNSGSENVTYSSGGDKTVTVTVIAPSGCPVTSTYKLHIYECTNPSIPHNTIIIDSNTQVIRYGKHFYWVNPGINIQFWGSGDPYGDTLFVEAGASISSWGRNNIYYLKTGASYDNADPSAAFNKVYYANGVSLTGGMNRDYVISCPNLDFDYTNAPPNPKFPQNGVVNTDDISKAITISPNPTTGSIIINGLPQDIMDIAVMNLLGATEMKIAMSHSSDLRIDLGTLSPGVYYIRFSMPGAVVTKKIVKQ